MDKKILLEFKKEDFFLKVKIFQLILEKFRQNNKVYIIFRKYEEFIKKLENDIQRNTTQRLIKLVARMQHRCNVKKTGKKELQS